MKTESDFFFDLIDAVREEDVLYSKDNPLYMDKTAKKEAWQRVGSKLGKGYAECEKRWLLLRERYTRESKKLLLASGSATPQEALWPYLEPMAFLEAHVKRRRTKDNLIPITCEPITYLRPNINVKSRTSTPASSEIGLSSPSSVHSLYEEPVSTSKQPEKKKQKLIETASEQEVDDSFKEVLDAYKKKLGGAETEDELFMRTILKMMEPLPLQSRDNIKKQIFDIVLLERNTLM